MNSVDKIAVGILGTGSAVPEQVMTNADFERMVDTSDEWITSRTGIKERRIARSDQASSDLAFEAAQRAIHNAGIRPEDIEMIIVATITPDMMFPATACIVQERLGLSSIPAFDLSAGCSGFVYALDVGSQMVRSGYGKVLVIGVDLLSKITDYEDRSTCILFGDGAGAAVLSQVPDGYGFICTELGADGAGGLHLKMPAGGSRLPASAETVSSRQHFVQMAGNDVFKFAVRIMNESTQRVLGKANLTSDDIRWFIPHQANIRIIHSAASRLGIGEERIFINVDKYGNTSAASIAMALDEVVQSGTVKDGDNLLIVGFGAGLTWGAAVIKWYGSTAVHE